jgi:hypothetical protein
MVTQTVAVRSHRLGQIYRGMKKRCENQNATGFQNYGGRGILICEKWRDFPSFVADVLASIGERPTMQHTLDKINNSGNYEPGNIRWATKSEQARNRRNNHRLTAFGKTQTLEEWASEMGIPKSTLFNRIKRGWPDEDVIAKDVHPKADDCSIFPSGGFALCQRLGINPQTVQSRLRRGWSFESAIKRPVDTARGRSIDRYAQRRQA